MSDMLFDIPRPDNPPKNPVPEIYDKQYKHSIVDSKKTPIESLTAWLGGSNWQVDYYSQIFRKGEELKAFDPKSLNPYQNYHKINRLILKLQGAIDNNDETSSGRFELTGNAIIPPHPNLIPNVGDTFIADMGEGQAGQFTVTSIRKLANNLASAWNISFKHERGVDKQLEDLLESKVTRVSYYNRDYLITGQNAILATEDYLAVNNLNRYLKQISTQFITNHFSYEHHSLIIPEQPIATYDPFVTRAALRVISVDDVQLVRDIREYNCDDHRIPKFNDIYTAVIKRDSTLLYSGFRKFAKILASLLTPSVYQNSVRYTGIKAIVVPYRQQLDNDNYSELNNLIEFGRNSTIDSGLTMNGILDECHCYGNLSIPLSCECEQPVDNTTDDSVIGEPGFDIPKIGNTSYVLSDAFYDKSLIHCSLFERLLWNVLDDRPIDYEVVYKFAEKYHLWGRLEQYYLGPLLILLIRACLRGVR